MLHLNIGFSRKVGEANYGSRGASVNLEIEVESGTCAYPRPTSRQDRLLVRSGQIVGGRPTRRQRVLGTGSGRQSPWPERHRRPQRKRTQHSGNGPHAATAGSNGNGNGNGSHRASEKQMNFVNQLARSIRGLGRAATGVPDGQDVRQSRWWI